MPFVLLAVLATALLLVPTAPRAQLKRTDVPGYSFVQLTDNARIDWYPRVSPNGMIVWLGAYNHDPNATSGGFDQEVLFWDGVTIAQITDNNVIDRRPVVNNFGEIKLAEKPKVLVQLLPYFPDPSGDEVPPVHTPDKPLELVIAPGQTIMAKVRVERNEFKDRISFGSADSGRNLPHGVYVDNIGLNGLLIVEGQNERTFFITAAKWVPQTTRMFHLKAGADGNQTSWPVILHVRKPDELVQKPE